ncbi:MAG: Gfo/Idh/MocA family oxidoreductase, partial [Planctomycetales bacterium]|nr:Gfo/Idh/MocA family oxidoreductase [Planctomycetales bacterium]
DRVQRFTDTVREMGVEIVDSIPELLEKVDVVLLESVDGRIHVEHALPVIRAGKPLFIDKPLAGTLVDALVIYELAKKHNVPFFSSSSYRFSPGIIALHDNEQVGDIAGAATWGPCSYQRETLDMAFYGIHGIEALYTIMGSGCQTVSRIKTADTDLVSGTWAEGRIGTYRGIRKNKADAGAMVFGSKGIVVADKGGSYKDLCVEIGKFFRTRVPPVAAETTLEMFAFMAAADESIRRGGQPVSTAEMLEQAKVEAAGRVKELTQATSR